MAGTVLVTGATGHLGANRVRGLLDVGESVRCLVEPGGDQREAYGFFVDRGAIKRPRRATSSGVDEELRRKTA